MLDLELLLNQTDDVAKRLATKGVDPDTVNDARDAALRRRQLRAHLDQLRAEMNRRSKEVGRLLAAGGEGADQLRQELTDLKGRIAAAEEEVRAAEQASLDLLLELPNLPDPEAPVGEDETANVVLPTTG